MRTCSLCKKEERVGGSHYTKTSGPPNNLRIEAQVYLCDPCARNYFGAERWARKEHCIEFLENPQHYLDLFKAKNP